MLNSVYQFTQGSLKYKLKFQSEKTTVLDFLEQLFIQYTFA